MRTRNYTPKSKSVPQPIIHSDLANAPSQLEAEMQAVKEHFDRDFYLSRSPDLVGASLDLLAHYMQYGWREHRDPNRKFCTAYYLENNADIRLSGMNPFYHYIMYGRHERRLAQSYAARLAQCDYSPLVTAIVPNFNHARFLRRRLDSILNQTYGRCELLILDDCSKDGSLEIIREYEANHPDRIRTLINVENSGSVFSQWRKGIDNARGDLIWICESDDFCELDFLEHAVKPFADRSVMISFGRIQFADKSGNLCAGLDSYREEAEAGVWSKPLVRPASEWFRGTFAVSNIIPNVGGCLIRRQTMSEDIWSEALSYRIVGDWYLYCRLSNGGQIAYVPKATAYFRQHGRNTSVVSFTTPHYYIEHEKIITTARKQFGTPDDVAVRCYVNIYRQFHRSKASPLLGDLTKLYSNDRVLSTHKETQHILMCFLGFHLGGGELFPIHLANQLCNSGYIVSMLCLDTTDENQVVRSMLDSRIAIYDAQYVSELGIEKFIASAGIDIIHSHNVGVEFLFFNNKNRYEIKIPYVITLHGSYEVTPIPEDMLLRTLRAVSQWVYLSQKNLEHLKGIPLSDKNVCFIANGMPADDREFAQTRSDLGIGDDDLVFTIASRGIKEKGWRPAIAALKMAQRHTACSLHLMLCGTGPEADLLQKEFADEGQVHFMGFQERISGAYRLSDAALLPTRFLGESYPLSLIQAMQVGLPIIATDIGEIRNMLLANGSAAGVVVPPDDDDAIFASSIADAMIELLDDAKRAQYAAESQIIGREYSMDVVTRKYVEMYKRCLKQNRCDPQSAIRSESREVEEVR